MKRLVDFDGLTGMSTYVDYDHQTKVTSIIEEQDAEAIIECNKQLANDTSYKDDGIKRSWMHLATIPNGVINKMIIDTGLEPYSKEGIQYLIKMVHDRDFNKLKVAQGRYIR